MAALWSWSKRAAELVGALFFLVMFVTFLLQILFRYVIGAPLGWTLEVCLIAYIWFVFWAASFMLKEEEHVSFNLLQQAVGARTRRVFAGICLAVTLIVFALALPATADFVQFMKIDKTWQLGIRFDVVFSVFVLFMVAVMARAAHGLWRLWRGEAL